MRFSNPWFIGVVISTSCFVAGCASSGNSNKPAPRAADTVFIEYRLPQLEMELAATYQLRACKREIVDAKTKTTFTVKTEIVASPKISVQGVPAYRFYPGQVSARNSKVDNNLTVKLFENGTINKINSEVTDQTGSIIGNIFKIATNILTLGFGVFADLGAMAATADPICNVATVAKLAQADELVARIKQLKTELNTKLKTTAPSAAFTKEINAFKTTIASLESQLTELRTSHLTLKKTYKISAADLGQSHFVSPTIDDLKKWLIEDQIDDVEAIVMSAWVKQGWQAPPEGTTHRLLMTELRFEYEGSVVAAPSSSEPYQIVLRTPVTSQFEICEHACRKTDGSPSGTKRQARGSVQIPQWGSTRQLDFTVRKFEKRTLNLTLNAAGSTKDLTWNKPSKTARAVESIASASTEAKTFAETVVYGRETAEIKALETETKLLNKRVELDEAQDKYDAHFSTDDTN